MYLKGTTIVKVTSSGIRFLLCRLTVMCIAMLSTYIQNQRGFIQAQVRTDFKMLNDAFHRDLVSSCTYKVVRSVLLSTVWFLSFS